MWRKFSFIYIKNVAGATNYFIFLFIFLFFGSNYINKAGRALQHNRSFSIHYRIEQLKKKEQLQPHFEGE
jgi:hypothetical protein